jgi:hypothetical protein
MGSVSQTVTLLMYCIDRKWRDHEGGRQMLGIVRRTALVLAGIAFVALLGWLHPLHANAATLTVTTTADPINGDGLLSLREAITCINNGTNANAADCPAAPSPAYGTSDEIDFNIAVSGVQTITLASQLPDLIKPMKIDGYTEPTASTNTLAVGDDANIRVVLTTNATISGLAINSGARSRGWHSACFRAQSSPRLLPPDAE